MPNSLNLQRKGRGLGATDSAPQPGDFPLGSTESRAAARAKMQRELDLAPYDRDCLQIVFLLAFTTNCHSPSERDVRYTDVWQRGWELRQALFPIVPYHVNPFYKEERNFVKCRYVYSIFYILRRRFPTDGDMLRRQEIEAVWRHEAVEKAIGEMRAAWFRRLPQFPCPVRFEQGRIQLRSCESKRGQEIWEKNQFPSTATEIWPLIEAEALSKDARQAGNRAAMNAIVFREDEAGNYCTGLAQADDKGSPAWVFRPAVSCP